MSEETSSCTTIPTEELVFAQNPDDRLSTPAVLSPEGTQEPDLLEELREFVDSLRSQSTPRYGPERSPEMLKQMQDEAEEREEAENPEEAAWRDRHYWETHEIPNPPPEIARKRARAWMGTHQSMDKDEVRHFRASCYVNSVEYAEIFEEKCPQTGKVHYHSVVYFSNPVRFKTVAELDPSAHWDTKNNGLLGIYKYVSKEKRPFLQYGEIPDVIKKYVESQFKKNAAPKKSQFDTIVEMIKDGKYEQIQEERVYAQYQRFFDQLAQKSEPSRRWMGNLQEKNHWIWGPPGSGKSSAIWDAAERDGLTIYQKLQNKWWDGYKGEDIVLIEDADPEIMKKLASFIKVWSDRYPFTYEVKGSSRTMKTPGYHFIVTSNYPMKDCFNETDLKAIERRFEEHFMDLPSVEDEDH